MPHALCPMTAKRSDLMTAKPNDTHRLMPCASLQFAIRNSETLMHLSPLGTDSETIVFHHGGTESTERNFLFARSASGSESLRLGEETAIGQKIAALRARSSNRVAVCRGLEIYHRAFAEGGGSFPWPSLPAREKTSLLCALRVSVVSKSIYPTMASAVWGAVGPRIAMVSGEQ
jgi:hypothetical protein